MFIRRQNIAFSLALLVSAALPGRCLAATIFDFNYLLAPPPASPGYVTISASGTLTANLDSGTGLYVVSDIAGTFTLGPDSTQITGLLPPGAYYNSNILYYPNQPLLDSLGIGFTIADPTLSDDGLGDVGIFYSPGFSYLDFNPANVFFGNGTFDVSLATPSPEPATAMPLIGGLLAIAGLIRLRR